MKTFLIMLCLLVVGCGVDYGETTFTHDGHKFIKCVPVSGKGVALIHHPDCSCGKGD